MLCTVEVVEGSESILKKRSVRLYPRILPLKMDQKNLGITAIKERSDTGTVTSDVCFTQSYRKVTQELTYILA